MNLQEFTRALNMIPSMQNKEIFIAIPSIHSLLGWKFVVVTGIEFNGDNIIITWKDI